MVAEGTAVLPWVARRERGLISRCAAGPDGGNRVRPNTLTRAQEGQVDFGGSAHWRRVFFAGTLKRLGAFCRRTLKPRGGGVKGVIKRKIIRKIQHM